MTIDDLIQELVANNDGKKDELISTIEKAANYGYKVAVDKACDWFEEKACCGWIEDVEVKYFIEDFRKAMKGGEE